MKKGIKVFAASLISIFLLAASVCAQSPQDKYISGTAVSPEFYSAIAGTLNVSADSTITAEQLAGISGSVNLKNDGLGDTRGLSLLTGATSIDLSRNTFKTVGENAFRNLTKLQNAVLPDSVTTISEGAFYGDSSLVGISNNDMVSFPSRINFIGADAFNGAGFTKISFDDDTSVGARAFANEKNLKSVDLPSYSKANFDKSAFYGDSAEIDVEFGDYNYFTQNTPSDFTNYEGNNYFKDGSVTLDISKTGTYTLSIPASKLNFTGGITSFNITYDVKAVPIYDKVKYVTLNENQEWDGGAPISVPYAGYGVYSFDKPKHALNYVTNEMGIIIYQPEKDFVGADKIDWSWSNGTNTFSGTIYINVVKPGTSSGNINSSKNEGSENPVRNPKTGGTPVDITFIAALSGIAGATALATWLKLIKK